LFSPETFGFGFRAREAASFAVSAIHSSATAGYGDGSVLTASLTDPNSSATGTVTYSTESHCQSETELTVSVTGATDNASLDISIGGTVVGTLMTDSTGAGKLVLSSNPSGSEQSLPSNFPTSIAAGTAITVGSLSGSFAASTSTGGSNDGGSGGCSHSQGTTLSASLTDPTGSDIGTATLTTKTYDGTTTTKLTVSVTGAADGASLDVVVDGTTVGTLTTDSTGAGTLVLSSNPTGTEQSLPPNFPTISAGSTITLGSLSGTFAISTTSVSAHFGHTHHVRF
jgi:hypothetical protein